MILVAAAAPGLAATGSLLTLLGPDRDAAEAGELLAEHFHEIVERHDSQQRAPSIDDGQAAHAGATHRFDPGEHVLVVAHSDEIRGGDVADLELAERLRRARYRPDDDVAVGQDPERDDAVVQALDDDDIADALLAHEPGGGHERLVRTNDHDLADTYFADVHAWKVAPRGEQQVRVRSPRRTAAEQAARGDAGGAWIPRRARRTTSTGSPAP